MPGEEGNPPSPLVRSLVDHCKQMNIPLIMGCDANAHNTAWASSDTNDRGKDLLEFIVSSDLEILKIRP